MRDFGRSRLRLVRAAAALAATLLGACEVGPEPSDPPPDPTPDPTDLENSRGFAFGDELRCDDGLLGIDRLSEEAAARGLDVDQDPAPGAEYPHRDPMAGGVILTDLDGDGDVDVVLGDFPGFPAVFVNDGGGFFTRSDVDPPPLSDEVREVGFFGAADFTGDGLPEIALHGPGFTVLSENLGGLAFGAPAVVHANDPDEPRGLIQTGAYGDVDGDGDLDMLLPVVHQSSGGPEGGGGGGEGGGNTDLPEPGFDLLYVNEGDDGWRLSHLLSPEGDPGHAQVAVMTDFDRDGDQDVLIPSEFGDRSERTALYRNDGLDESGDVVLVNVAPELTADIDPGAMGIDSFDANKDGRLDYCVSSVGPPQCLMSLGEDGYVEGAAAFGLTIPESFDRAEWSSYSVEFADLDNDGFPDAAISAGPPTRDDPNPLQPDALYRGTAPGTVEEVTDEVGFGDERRHYALASADLDRDGHLDLLVTGTEGPPVLWMNTCGPHAWLAVDLVGPGLNAEGFGALVTVRTGERTQMRELYNLRAIGQGPSELHFGLGDVDAADEVRVRWADGATSVYYDAPVRRRVTVTHPDRVD